MLKVFTMVLLMTTYACSSSQKISGYWTGNMEMNGKKVDMIVDFNKQTLSSSDLMLFKVPVEKLRLKEKEISFSYFTYDASIEFNGIVEKDIMKGELNVSQMPPEIKMHFQLKRQSTDSPDKTYIVEKLTVKSIGADLSAEIFKPETSGMHPGIVILPGSARNNPKENFTFYADFFVKLGFEVLIFDKRGSGQSTGCSISASYEDLTEDAVSCLKVLAERESVDKDKIGLWGISQGGMILPFIASKSDIPSFLIAVSPEIKGESEAAAFADSLAVVRMGFLPEQGHIAALSHKKVAEMIAKGSTNKEVELFINNNADKYAFMNYTGLYGNISIDNDNFNGLYWTGRKFNFQTYWEKLDIKTVCIFGADDALVNAEKNFRMIKELKNDKIESKIFENANHIIKKTFNPQNISEFDFPRIKEGYLDYTEEWIKKEVMKSE